MQRAVALLTGAGAGAGLMYLLDPERGKRRRALARDKAVHLKHQEARMMGKALRDLENRSEGLFHRATSVFKSKDAPDEILVERVRSELGRFTSHPSSIEVSVEDGVAIVSGPVLAHEADGLLSAIEKVPGISRVEDCLDRHRDGSSIPGLQGKGRQVIGKRKLVRTDNWMPAVRLCAGALGLGTAAAGWRRGGPNAPLLQLAGGALFLRAATNLSLRRMLGFGGRRGIDLQKTVTIHAPVDEVYEFLRNFENLPRFMQHIETVRTQDHHSVWKVRGPAGTTVTWEAEITRDEPGELLCWKTKPGASVEHAGRVRFEAIDENTTRLDIDMSYNPPAGAIGHMIASVFRVDPKHALDEDMVRFKSLLEAGKTRAHGERVLREEIQGPSWEEEERRFEEAGFERPLH